MLVLMDLEVACDPFEICPANTALAGVAVFDDGDPTTLTNRSLYQNGLEQCPAGT